MIVLLLFFVAIQSKVMEKLPLDHKDVLIPFGKYEFTSKQILNLRFVKQPSGYNASLYYKESDKEEKPANIEALKSYKKLSPQEIEDLGCYLNSAYVQVTPIAEHFPVIDNTYFSSMFTIGDEEWTTRLISESDSLSKKKAQEEYIGRSYVIDNSFNLKEIHLKFVNYEDGKKQTTDKKQNKTKSNETRNTPEERGDKPLINEIYFSNVTVNVAKYLDLIDQSVENKYPIGDSLMLYYDQVKTGYILTQYGALTFYPHAAWTNESSVKFMKQKEFIKRQQINYAHINQENGYLFTANGNEGVDIYQIQESGDLVHLFTLEANVGYSIYDGFPENVNIIDVNMNTESNILFALDSLHGLHFFDIHDPQNPIRRNYLINVPNAKAFDFCENTVVIVFSTPDSQDVVAEFFVSYENGDYYINNLQQYHYSITDIELNSHYVILMGSDTNLVYPHSIYNGYRDLRSVETVYFQGFGVSSVSLFHKMDDKNVTHSYLLTMGMDSIKIYTYHQNPPKLQCLSKESAKLNLAVQMNSTVCSIEEKFISPFFYCQLTHFMYLEIEGIALRSNKKKLAMILGLCLGITLLLAIIIAIVCCCRQKKKTEEKQEKYNSYQNIEVIEQPEGGEKMSVPQ